MPSSTRGYSPDPGQEFRVLVNAWNRNYVAYHTVGGDILCQRWSTISGWFGRTWQDWKDYPADQLDVRCTVVGDRSDRAGEAQRTWTATATRTHYCVVNLWAAGFNISFDLDADFSPSNPGAGAGPVPQISAKQVIVNASVRIGTLVLAPDAPAIWPD